MPDLALQLYTVRDALQADFDGTLRRITEMGYQAVETAGMYGGTPEQAARLFESLGLRVISAHVMLPLGDQKNAVLEMLDALRVKTLVCPWQAPENFTDVARIQAICDLLNAAHAELQPHGIRLAYHNHDFECIALPDGRLPLLYMAQQLPPEIVFEVDTYWVQTAGVHVPDLLTQLGERAALLHLKDGSTRREDSMVALGDGAMDFPAIVHASRAEAWIVELDRCETDMLEAVAKSLAYAQRLS